jgi:hypothetical protein
MNCPKCSAELTSGYLSASGTSIYWFFDALPGWKKFIGDGQNVARRNGKVPGASCVTCGLVVLDGLKLKLPTPPAK